MKICLSVVILLALHLPSVAQCDCPSDTEQPQFWAECAMRSENVSNTNNTGRKKPTNPHNKCIYPMGLQNNLKENWLNNFTSKPKEKR